MLGPLLLATLVQKCVQKVSRLAIIFGDIGKREKKREEVATSSQKLKKKPRSGAKDSKIDYKKGERKGNKVSRDSWGGIK